MVAPGPFITKAHPGKPVNVLLQDLTPTLIIPDDPIPELEDTLLSEGCVHFFLHQQRGSQSDQERRKGPGLTPPVRPQPASHRLQHPAVGRVLPHRL